MTPTRTPAIFHLPHSSQEPLELTVQVPAMAMAVVHRDALGQLNPSWSRAIGIYVLLGPPGDETKEYRAYVGKSETCGVRQRLTTHRNSTTWQKAHGLPSTWWTRALIVRSRDEDGFHSAQVGGSKGGCGTS